MTRSGGYVKKHEQNDASRASLAHYVSGTLNLIWKVYLNYIYSIFFVIKHYFIVYSESLNHKNANFLKRHWSQEA